MLPTAASQTSPAARAGDIPSTSQEFEDFIYLISHDVRNSVRALIELPQWIADDLSDAGIRLDGEIARNIDLMNVHTGRLDRMLVDLLAFSRVGRMQEISETNLDEALTEVLEEVRLPAGFRLIRALEVQTVLMGERDVLTLLSALISNAVKHHDRAAGKIVVASHRVGNDLVLRVSDNGPGIPRKFHDRVFAAMTTLRPRDETEGSGMGLAIAKKIALRYGGRIELQCREGVRGTTVEVRMPLD